MKSSRIIFLTFLMCLLVPTFFLSNAAGQKNRRRQGGGPPPQALEACQGSVEGDSCKFQSPHGMISGACRTIQGRIACVPGNSGPRQNMGTNRKYGSQTGSTSNQPLNYTSAASTITAKVNSYKIVDTGQSKCFGNKSEISAPRKGRPFYGQDAQHKGTQPSYTNNGDGTVVDNATGLMWQRAFKILSYQEAMMSVKSFKLGGYTDWRVPNIKEAYSLILFSGKDVSSKDMTSKPKGGRPFIDVQHFDFEYGSNGSRVIDTQILSSTIYKGQTMGGMDTVFGVNVADGRIKGYPIQEMRGGNKKYTVRFVRGNQDYGKNNYVDNNDGTISDLATNLMWTKADSKNGMNWEKALAWVAQKNRENHLGHNDWRLPNAKELQSIVDYSRSPQQTNSPAINRIFMVTTIKDEGDNSNYPFYWSSTTHENLRGGKSAAYVSFGEALGFFGRPRSSSKTLIDVHGAGAQRSDPKTGNPNSYPQGHGPQGDVIRINNFIRMVRDL